MVANWRCQCRWCDRSTQQCEDVSPVDATFRQCKTHPAAAATLRWQLASPQSKSIQHHCDCGPAKQCKSSLPDSSLRYTYGEQRQPNRCASNQPQPALLARSNSKTWQRNVNGPTAISTRTCQSQWPNFSNYSFMKPITNDLFKIK